MNFLDIINKCLLELNYKQVNSMSELIKQEHKKIVNIINIVNREICNSEKWNFLIRKLNLSLPSGTIELPNTVEGRILYLLIDTEKYLYTPDLELFFNSNPKPRTYSSYSDKLLLPKFNKDKVINVIYYTNNCCASSDGKEKDTLSAADDKTLIPMPYCEQLLVYGTCLRVKANPAHIKFSYWMSMYKEALLNLKSKTEPSCDYSPSVRLFRS